LDIFPEAEKAIWALAETMCARFAIA